MSEHQLQTSEWIGIDLGITHTAAAIYVAHQSGPGNAEMLVVESNDTLTESCVYFDQESDVVLVGRMAAYKKIRNPSNTILESKRLIGLPFSDNLVNEFRGKFKEYNMVDSAGHAAFEIHHNGRTIRQTPIEITAKILEKIRKTADEWANGTRKYTKAIITVPLYFGQEQLDGTIRAAKLAGFSEVHLIGEPNAAAIFSGFRHFRLDGYTILVLDMGSTTLDVSIMKGQNGVLKVLATCGRRWLGGWNLDEQFRTFIIKRYEHFPAERRGDKRDMQELLGQCKNITKNLSKQRKSSIFLDCIGLNGKFTLDLKTYLHIMKGEFKEIIKTVYEALESAGLNPVQIQELQMTGDSSCIPILMNLLEEMGFTRDKIKCREPKHVVAKGAAIVGAQLDEQMKTHLPTLNSIGTEIYASSIHIKSNGTISTSENVQIPSTISSSNHHVTSKNSTDFPNLPCAINFGTYSSFAAIFCEKEPQLIKLDSDSYELPSIVSFDIAGGNQATFSNLLIGNEAKNGFTNSNKITILYPKILLENPDKNYELFPALFYHKNANGRIKIVISNESQERPEQIAAERLLSHIYLRLEKMSPLIFARRKLPLDIVIPIPFAFSSLHKPILNELMDRILKINEGPKPKSNCIFIEFSHCSAIAYARTKIDDGVALVNGFKILSVHVGGGFFDIALIKIDMHGYSMEEVDGSFFGKVDCDKTLLKEIIKQYNNIPENEYQKLLARCETASVKILEQKFATISNDGISGLPSIAPRNCNFVCPWYKFVQNQNENMLSMLNNNLDDGIKKMTEIEETTIPVLSGCIAAKPHFQNYLSKALSINVNKFVHIKKEEIAKAASLHAFLRKLPISVGFSESNGKYKRIFKRGADVGFNISVSFQISELPLIAGKMKLIQGEREFASENSIFCEISIPEKIEIDQHYYKIHTIKFILNNFGRFSILAFDKSNKIFAAEIFHVDYLEKIMPINYIGEHLAKCSGEAMSDLMKLQNMKIEIFSKNSNNTNLLKMVKKASDYIKNLDPDMQVENQNHLEMITSIKINEEKVRKLKNFISHLKSLPTQMPNQMGASTSAKEKNLPPDGWIEKSERIDEDLFFPNKYSIFALFDSIQNLYKCNNMRILSGSNRKQFVWYCVLVDQKKLMDFDSKIVDDTLNVAEFGRILYSDWGKYPSQKIRDEIQKKFLPEIDQDFRENFLEEIDKKLEIEIEAGLCKEYSGNKFFMAVFRGDFQAVKNMFKEDNARIVAEFKYNKLKLQPLHLAIWKNHLDIANFLLENGANIADMALINLGKLHFEISAFHLSIWKYQESESPIEETFLSRMIDLTPWKSQRTRAFEQIFLSRMVKHNRPPHFSTSPDGVKSDFIHAIQLAAIRNKIELIHTLIDGNAPGLEKAHKLHIVTGNSTYKIFFKCRRWFNILIDEKKLEDWKEALHRSKTNNVDISNYGEILSSGWGAVPISNDEKLYIQFFRNYGTMHEAFEGCCGQTPMHFLSEYGGSEWFGLPEIDVTIRRKTDNFTPLHVAIAERRNVNDFTLLYLFRKLLMKNKTKIENEMKELISELIRFAARIGNVFALGHIEREIKCVYDDHILFNHLLNYPDKEGFTPLHIAAKYNNENIVTELLKHDCDIKQKVEFEYAGNSKCLTAKELAAFYGHKQMEEIFKKYSV